MTEPWISFHWGRRDGYGVKVKSTSKKQRVHLALCFG